jgi:hypothetical protein
MKHLRAFNSYYILKSGDDEHSGPGLHREADEPPSRSWTAWPIEEIRRTTDFSTRIPRPPFDGTTCYHAVHCAKVAEDNQADRASRGPLSLLGKGRLGTTSQSLSARGIVAYLLGPAWKAPLVCRMIEFNGCVPTRSRNW